MPRAGVSGTHRSSEKRSRSWLADQRRRSWTCSWRCSWRCSWTCFAPSRRAALTPVRCAVCVSPIQPHEHSAAHASWPARPARRSRMRIACWAALWGVVRRRVIRRESGAHEHEDEAGRGGACRDQESPANHLFTRLVRMDEQLLPRSGAGYAPQAMPALPEVVGCSPSPGERGGIQHQFVYPVRRRVSIATSNLKRGAFTCPCVSVSCRLCRRSWFSQFSSRRVRRSGMARWMRSRVDNPPQR